MKYLLLLVVVGLAFWMFKARQRGAGAKPPAAPRPAPQAAPMPMLACAHCSVHLPQGEAVIDADGRPYCSAAHLQAGPR